MEKEGMINRYTCEACGKFITTINLAEGVTPAFIGCRFGCGGTMRSHWYRVPQQVNMAAPNQYEWYKPENSDVLEPGERQHVEQGGLLLRRHFTVLDAFRGNCACGKWLVIAPNVPESDPLVCECGRKYYAERDDDDNLVYQRIDIEEETAVSQPTATSSAKTHDVGIADPHIVKQLTGHLLKAYDDFIDNYPGKVDYIDGFMAAHNVHRWIVLHLEEVTEDKKRLWRKMAVDTFKNTMDNPEGKGDPT